MQIDVKPMNQGHVAQIAEIEERCFLTPWSQEALMGELDNPLSCYLVALEGEKVTAYGGFWALPRAAARRGLSAAPLFAAGLGRRRRAVNLLGQGDRPRLSPGSRGLMLRGRLGLPLRRRR